MTFEQKILQASYNPTAGASYGTLRETVRVFDDEAADVTPASVSSVTPSKGDAPSLSGSYPAGYYCVGVTVTQGDTSKYVDIQADYTNETNWIDSSSTDPQEVNREAAGYCQITTQTSITFVDIWSRNTVAIPFYYASAPTGNITDVAGVNIGSGNVDMAGQPISQAIIKDDVTISLTRTETDGVDWIAIDNYLGTRNMESWLGFGQGKLLFTGCNVVETFGTGTVSYDLTFVAEQNWHLRQYVGKVADFIPTTPDSGGIDRASNVFMIQPFPEASATWTSNTAGLITTQEADLLTPKIS